MNHLKKISALPPKSFTKSKCEKELMSFHKRLFELQNVFYANARYGLLVILQGVDTSGKDGTIRHVMTCMNPMGLHVQSFKKPTVDELKHDFLWRIYPHIPPKSIIQVFNRSYYEDIIMPVINDSISKKKLKHRMNLVNELEEHFVQNDVHVLKFFLHISPHEQKARIKGRMKNPHKRWKYSNEDKKAADKWVDYLEIYNTVIRHCKKIPWHIIPSDKRWYRNFCIAKVMTEYLVNLNLKYPKFK